MYLVRSPRARSSSFFATVAHAAASLYAHRLGDDRSSSLQGWPRRRDRVHQPPEPLRAVRARPASTPRDVIYFLSITVALPRGRLPRAREPEVGLSPRSSEGNQMAMERKKKAATESGALLLIIAAILVAVNTLSYFMYCAQGHDEARSATRCPRAAVASSGRSRTASRSTSTPTSRMGLPKLDAFVRDLRDLLQQYEEPGAGKFDYTIIEAKTEERAQEGRRRPASRKLQLRRGLGHARTRPRSRRATWASSSTTAARRTASRSSRPTTTRASSSGSRTRSARSATRATSIKHKIGVLTGHDEIKLSRREPRRRRSGGGRRPDACRAIIEPVLPVLQVRGRRPEERRRRDRRGARRPHHHAARRRTSPRRSCAASTSS